MPPSFSPPESRLQRLRRRLGGSPGTGAAVARAPRLPPSEPKPRFWRRVRRRLVFGGARKGRGRRYALGLTIGLAAIWGAAGAYLKLMPRSYTSTFVMVLPGTGAGASVNLESIGSATSTSSAAFSSPDFSPTQNYKKMLLSDRVLGDTAKSLGMAEGKFPTPRVELTDQTKLIGVSVRGPSAAMAEERAGALQKTFLSVLDELRRQEIDTRDNAYREMLAGYQQRLDQARRRILAHQAETGLVSLDQYSTIVLAVERLREQLRDLNAKLAESHAMTGRLVSLLGSTPELANAALLLHADPITQELLSQLAKQEAEIAMLAGTRGGANPRLADAQAERGSTLRRLAERVAEVTGSRTGNVLQVRDLSLRDERARLFERLVSTKADQAGLEGMQRQLVVQIEIEQAKAVRLATQASRLDELRRELQVAEAVFSSALARIDTSRADIFASYPMLQTLEPPSLPSRASSPLPVLAIAGGAGASFFLILALGLTWLRAALMQRILRSGSSSPASPGPGAGMSSAPSTLLAPSSLPA